MILPSRPIRFAACILAALSPLAASADNPRLRLVCVTALAEDSAVAIASKGKDGKWEQHGKVALRSSLVSDWISVTEGEIHIISRQGGGVKSLGNFAFPADVRRALVILTPGAEAGTYQARAVNAHADGFAKGSTLVLNLSEEKATVALGGTEALVEPGQHHVATPASDESGGYRLTVSREIDGQPTLCYDRQRVANANSRNILVIMPDETTGLRVEGLPLFGDLD